MDKQKVLFVVIAVAIMSLAMFVLPPLLYPPKAVDASLPPVSTTPVNPAPTAGGENAQVNAGTVAGEASSTTVEGVLDPSRPLEMFLASDASGNINAERDPAWKETVEYVNETYRAVFSGNGARLVDLQLLEHKDGDAPVRMLFEGENSGLITRFGGYTGQMMLEPFTRVAGTTENVVEFKAYYVRNNTPGKVIAVTKRYVFYPKEYAFNLEIGFAYSDSSQFIPASGDGYAYTVAIGPQIGPLSSQITNNGDYRRLAYHTGTKKESPAAAPGMEFPVQDKVRWGALDGKYFSFIMVPPASAEHVFGFKGAKITEQMPSSEVRLARKAIMANRNQDTFTFYVGPKLSDILSRYNSSSNNALGLSDLKFNELVDFDLFAWLATPMKWIMNAFYFVIPNWGVAIIFLTILVKVALFPLSKKSAEGMARMAELNPKIKALQEKHANDPQKMNQEMAALYQKEKINPLGGCLPLLLQFPFFFAMNSLFGSHFEMRGAMFIPGWIPDLSLPESIFSLTQVGANFTIPLLNLPVTDIRLLPFIYLATQLLSTKFMPNANTGQSNAQMKIMMYGMPIMFLFILYNASSGLIVYWIFQNVLSVVQQIIVSRMMERKKAAAPAESVIRKQRRGAR